VAARLLGFLRDVMPPPFLVFALPRSRTAWLSRFLTYGPFYAGHDEVRHCRSLEDVRAWLGQPGVGSVETAVGPFWRLLRALQPDARVVVVRRPVDDVVASLMGTGLGCFDPAVVTPAMHRLDRKLEQIERRVPGVLSVAYSDLDDEATCARVFEHCLGLPHDHAWWAAVSAVNIQVNLAHVIRYYNAHAPQLAKLAKLAAHRIIASMQPADTAGELDGVSFHVEPFRSFYADGQALIAEHCVQTEQAPDDHERINLPLFEALDDIGALQVMTARVNGRLWGYLLTIVGPTLEAPDKVQATHTAFYTSPVIRGLGMRLQRAALDALRARGVDEVIMRVGHRGAGPRLGTIYRRLGAEQFGEMYRMELG